MKRYAYRLLWGGIFFCLVLLGACKNTEDQSQTSPQVTPKRTMETISIYTIDSDTMTLVPLELKREQSLLTPQYITSLVEAGLDDDSIRVYSVEQEDDRIIFSFYGDGKPFVKCSKKMETLILDCFANSLLDNVENSNDIVYRCEKKPYKSKNYSFKLNEVYASE